MLGVSKIVQ